MSVARPLVLDRRRAESRLRNLPTFVAAGFALAALLSLLYVAQTSSVAITGYDIQELQAERAQWQLRNDQLRLRIAEAQSLDRIELEARARLDMAPPERAVFVRQPAAAKRIETPDAAPGFRGPLDAALQRARAALSWLRGES